MTEIFLNGVITDPDTITVNGTEYTRAQPKYKRVDLETFYKNTCNCEGDGGPCMSCAHDFGWNECIDDIKSKYGDLYAEVK